MPTRFEDAARDYGREVGSEFREHVGSSLRHWFDVGGVYYVSAVALLCLATVFYRFRQDMLNDYDGSLRGDLLEMMTARFEPQTSETAFGVVAAVLGGLNQAERPAAQTHCPEDKEECRAVTRFLNEFVEMGQKWAQRSGSRLNALTSADASAYWDALQPGPPPPGPPDTADAKRLAEAKRTWERAVGPAPGNLPAGATDVRLRACEIDRTDTPEKKSHDRDWGPMFCADDGMDGNNDVARLFVSSWAIPDALSYFDPRKGTVSQVPFRVARSVRASRLLVPALEVAGYDLLHAAESHEGYRLVQAYFVGPDDVLRIWQPTRTGSPYPNQFPRTRHWLAGHYSLHIVEGEREANSPAYVDYGGHGVIASQCRSVLGPPLRETQTPELLGVVCADTSVPESAIARHLKDGRLVSAAWVAVHFGASGVVASDGVQTRDLAEVAGDKATTPPEDSTLAEKLRQALGRWQPQGPPALALSRQVTPLLWSDGPTRFFIPTGRSGDAVQGFLVWPEIEYPREVRWLFGGFALSTLLALILGTMGTVRARTRSEGDLIANLLRGLQSGVLVVDERDFVEAANTRAEHVLGVPLPRFGPGFDLARGTSGASLDDPYIAGWRISDLIEDDIWEVIDDERLQENKFGQRIPELRREGLSSIYYAKLRVGVNKDKWVRFLAGPVEPDRASRGPARTFGLIDLVPPVAEAALEARMNRNRNRDLGVREQLEAEALKTLHDKQSEALKELKPHYDALVVARLRRGH